MNVHRDRLQRTGAHQPVTAAQRGDIPAPAVSRSMTWPSRRTSLVILVTGRRYRLRISRPLAGDRPCRTKALFRPPLRRQAVTTAHAESWRECSVGFRALPQQRLDIVVDRGFGPATHGPRGPCRRSARARRTPATGRSFNALRCIPHRCVLSLEGRSRHRYARVPRGVPARSAAHVYVPRRRRTIVVVASGVLTSVHPFAGRGTN